MHQTAAAPMATSHARNLMYRIGSLPSSPPDAIRIGPRWARWRILGHLPRPVRRFGDRQELFGVFSRRRTPEDPPTTGPTGQRFRRDDRSRISKPRQTDGGLPADELSVWSGHGGIDLVEGNRCINVSSVACILDHSVQICGVHHPKPWTDTTRPALVPVYPRSPGVGQGPGSPLSASLHHAEVARIDVVTPPFCHFSACGATSGWPSAPGGRPRRAPSRARPAPPG
jgi:hypothetical protein